ncbi:MAG: L,D-transpeptidase catalytic domain protein [Methylocystaceae bacterium]|nr:L,D-transpeptidase catalytic domain protein [Methylocystaceae bacterium]
MRPRSPHSHSGYKISALHVFQAQKGSKRVSHLAILKIGSLYLKCSLGRSGRKALKREGDGASPIGTYRLTGLYFRPDRLSRPLCQIPTQPMRPNLGWCDDERHGQYNRLIRTPFVAGHEELWRKDHVYDLVFTINHNSRPRIKGAGSAIFIHLAHPNDQPTAGCVAVSLSVLRRQLPRLAQQVRLTIH